MIRRLLTAGVLTTSVLMVGATPASAHPLGNFTTNLYAGLVIGADEIGIDYVVDLAEVPTVREMTEVDLDGDGTVDDDEAADYVDDQCPELATGLSLVVADRTLDLDVVDGALSFPPGSAGLDTMRLECRFNATGVSLDGETDVRFDDTNLPDRIGWREITAIGDGTTIIDADVPTTSTSERLTGYPEERLGSPLDLREASLTVRPGGDALGPDPRVPGGAPRSIVPGFDGLADRFTDLVSEQTLTVPFGIGAVAVSMVLGLFHSLAPGHGKTVMAAYLVGRRSERRLTFLLALTVALSHTAGVVILGVAISASEVSAPDRLYPVLGAVSGALFASVGVVLLRAALQRRRLVRRYGAAVVLGGGDHAHVSDHDHDHDPDPDHDAGETHSHTVPVGSPGGGTVEGAIGHTTVVEATGAVAVGPLAAVSVEPLHEHPHAGHADHDHQHSDHGEHGDQHRGVDPELAGLVHSHGIGRSHVHALPEGVEHMGWRSIVVPGIAGGLVPSPAALLVFLGGVTLGRTWFGLLLVLAYGIGIGLSLVGAGYLLVIARDTIERRLGGTGLHRMLRVTAGLPVVTALLVIAGGLVLVVRSLAA